MTPPPFFYDIDHNDITTLLLFSALMERRGWLLCRVTMRVHSTVSVHMCILPAVAHSEQSYGVVGRPLAEEVVKVNIVQN